MKHKGFILGTVASTIPFWFFANVWLLLILVALNFLSSFSRPTWWADFFGLTSNLLCGGLISFLFYYLLVDWPEQRRKGIVRRNLDRTYRDIKKRLLMCIVHSANLGGNTTLAPDTNTLTTLMDPRVFRQTFEEGQHGNEGYYAVANHLQNESYQYRDILHCLEMLVDQIDYLLRHYGVVDQRAFDRFRQLELKLKELIKLQPDYNSSKYICQFFWQTFAGWSWIDGYRDYDFIEKLIAEL